MANKAVEKLNSYLPARLAIAPPKLGRPKKVQTLTFGPLVSEKDAKRHQSFIYEIIITVSGIEYHYIGSKQLKDPNWAYYRSSSKLVKDLLDGGASARYSVLCYADNSRLRLMLEDQTIVNRFIKYRNRCLNKSHVNGHPLQ
jgi:hypothetical protein